MSYARQLVPTIAAVLAIALTVSLGNWQMRRAAEKSEAHLQQQAALAEPPARLTASPLAGNEAAAMSGRRVVARGELLPEHSVYVDNRTHEGIAGFHLVTPLRIESRVSGEPLHVLVLRGWLPRDPRERTHLPVPPTPAAAVEIEGLAELKLPQTLELKQVDTPGPNQRIWQNLTRERFLAWSGLRLQPIVIRQTEAAWILEAPEEGASRSNAEDSIAGESTAGASTAGASTSGGSTSDGSTSDGSTSDGSTTSGPAAGASTPGSSAAGPRTEAARVLDDGLVREWHRPGPDVAKHHGYAFQWYALAAAVLVLWVWFLVVVPMKARRARQGEAKVRRL